MLSAAIMPTCASATSISATSRPESLVMRRTRRGPPPSVAPLSIRLRTSDDSNTESSVIIDISASRSCRFHASAKRSSSSSKSASERALFPMMRVMLGC